jgi:hypothetical protein
LSHAAQFIESTFSSDDIISLNKRLQWQIANQIRGLRYVKLNQSSLDWPRRVEYPSRVG